MKHNKPLTQCRISKRSNLIRVLSLGDQHYTGVFPADKLTEIPVGSLELVLCPESGLIQLGRSYDLSEMYGDNYGYRSGLNRTMVDHLKEKCHLLQSIRSLKSDDIVLDIGSNDGTLLNAYKIENLLRIGIDPTAEKFRLYYDKDITIVPEFFSAKAFKNLFPNRRAAIITSIAMLYDLEDPVAFVSEIKEILDQEGIWHFEQSYLPSMLKTNAYDTICHEHLEYYSLSVIKQLLDQNDLKIIDVHLNGINGGSFAVTAAHSNSKLRENISVINWILDQERKMRLNTTAPYLEFEQRINHHKVSLMSLLEALNADGKTVVGYGASTKGNVMLQFCGITSHLVPMIAEVNPYKFGRFTPGTKIPILPEKDVRETLPDYMLVLPWHFKESIISREREYLASGGRLIFPLPEIEII